MTVLFGPPCRTCGRAVTPATDDIVGGDYLRGHQCETCFLDEQNAYDLLLAKLAEQPDKMAACGQCALSVEHIPNKKLYMHVEVGNVSLLCRKCSDAYTAKMSTATVQGRYKHLSKEEMMHRMIKNHLYNLRTGNLRYIGKGIR